MMKLQAMTKLIALAASVALAGCMAPGVLKADLARPAATSTAVQKTSGTIELSVLWPDLRRGYGTQAIPNRATKVVVSVARADGSAVTDVSGQTIAPVTAERTTVTTTSGDPTTATSTTSTTSYLNTYGKFSWDLPQQTNLKIHADLYAGDAVIAQADRVVDVIAGFRSVVAMDLVLPDAPVITSMSTTSFRVGDTIVLSGKNFGSTQGWKARVFLQSEGNEEQSPFDDGPHFYAPPLFLPGDYVKVDSDDTITVTIPERIYDQYRSGFLTDFLWGYFNGKDPRLTLGVNVDGVNSLRIDVSMPKEVGIKANVTLEQGTDAPPHATDGQYYKSMDLTDATFSIPTASGSEWEFQSEGSDYYYNRQKTIVHLTDSLGHATVRYVYEFGTPYERQTDLNYDGEFGFLRRIDGQGSAILPDETVIRPDGITDTAKHVAYSYSNGALNDLWVVPNYGPVRMRQLNVNSYNGQLWRYVRDVRLVKFTPATASVGQ